MTKVSLFLIILSLSSYFSLISQEKKKAWTFIVYCAADNDLYSFAGRNIKQMEAIGSTDTIHILVQLDMHLQGKSKVTKRYVIKKNKAVLVETIQQGLDSGDPKTLIACCSWAQKNYPAEEYALIFWNHGTGILDPAISKIINPSELFTLNKESNMIELDRSIGFLDYIDSAPSPEMPKRGVCFDSTTGNYLTNKKLEESLSVICSPQILGKKFGIIGFDACLMSMLEITNIFKNYAYFLVGSQEAELGTGWGYSSILAPFEKGTLSPYEFAKRIVESYKETYENITNDYTQSAIDLSKIEALEASIHSLSNLLIKGILAQESNSLSNAIKASRKGSNCTHFSEPSYIDLHHFLSNLYKKINLFSLKNKTETTHFQLKMKNEIEKSLLLMEDAIIANVAGKDLVNAQGLSIYFPEKKIHTSYKNTLFSNSNSWPRFLETHLS